MNQETVSLTATTAAVGVTIVSIMVPNAIDARAVNDAMVSRAHVSALVAAGVLGLTVSILDGSPMPLIGGLLATGLVILAHNAIQANGMGELVPG
jgi:hypothetical protein